MTHSVLAENASKAIVIYLLKYGIDLKDGSEGCVDIAFDMATIVDEEWNKLGIPR